MQFVIFKPWKVSWNWIAFSQNYFVISPGLLYHLIRRDSGRLANEAFTSNPIVSVVSLKQQLNDLKITNCMLESAPNLWTYLAVRLMSYGKAQFHQHPDWFLIEMNKLPLSSAQCVVWCWPWSSLCWICLNF